MSALHSKADLSTAAADGDKLPLYRAALSVWQLISLSQVWSYIASKFAAASSITVASGDLVTLYDVSASNAASAVTMTTLAAAMATELNITSGTWTPTLTNGSNVAASTANVCQYQRVGSIVTFSGTVQVDPTAATTLTVIGLSLPIASAFTAATNLAGAGSCAALATDPAILVQADATNDRMQLTAVPGSASNATWYFSGSYRVM